MQKVQTTLKDIKDSHPIVARLSYCELQVLLDFAYPIAYCSNDYGWRCDLYTLSQTVGVCTGYAPTGNYRPSRELLEKYGKLGENLSGGDEARRLLQQFAKDIFDEYRTAKNKSVSLEYAIA